MPTTHDDTDMPDSGAIILTEVAENSETYYVRIDGIHEIIDPATINDQHGLVNLNQSDGNVEILSDMIPNDVENELSDNIGMHMDDKHYQTIDPSCMRIQVEHMEDVATNIENQQFFIASDCVVNK